MNEILTEKAGEDYFELVRIAWKRNLISSSQLHKCLRVLDDLRSPDKSWNYSPIWLRKRNIELEIESESESTTCSNPSSIQNEGQMQKPDAVPNPMMQFVARLRLCNWEFDIADPDPQPSVPHGHDERDHRQKLDAYLGFTYFGKKPTGRLTKGETVALWNDDKFRDFARKAIDHYVKNNPNYHFPRVQDPFRLPRKR